MYTMYILVAQMRFEKIMYAQRFKPLFVVYFSGINFVD